MSENLRVFVALPLTDDLVARLTALQGRLKADLPDRAVRWTRPHQIHLTLRFLGEVAGERADLLATALSEAIAGMPALDLHLQGLGVFPNARRPRVVWVGLHGDLDALNRVQQAVAAACVDFAPEKDRQTFKPHLTLGRVRDRFPGNTRAVADAFPGWRFDERLPWLAGEVRLVSSRLQPGGSVYDDLACFPLEPSSA